MILLKMFLYAFLGCVFVFFIGWIASGFAFVQDWVFILRGITATAMFLSVVLITGFIRLE